MDQEKMKFVRSVPFQVANLLPDEKQIYTFAVKLFSNEQESLFGFFGPKQYKLADGVFFLHLTDLRIVLEPRMLTEDEKKSIKIGEKISKWILPYSEAQKISIELANKRYERSMEEVTGNFLSFRHKDGITVQTKTLYQFRNSNYPYMETIPLRGQTDSLL